MAYDPGDREVVMFGGLTSTTLSTVTVLNDTWVFAKGLWSKLKHTHAPSPRYRAAATYDAADGYVLLYGGSESYTSGAVYNETWTFTHNHWTNLTGVVSGTPPALYRSAMTYDAADGYTVLFGGCTPTLCPVNWTWTYLHGTWVNLTSALPGAPPPSIYPSLAYDVADGYVLLFGGAKSVTGPLYGTTYEFLGGVWTRLNVSTAPAGRYGAAAAYDVGHSEVILFGGYGATSSLADTWTFSAGTWSAFNPPTAPPMRWDSAMVYDAKDRYLVMFGGYQPNSCCYGLGDTWEFTGRGWTQLHPVTSPSARGGEEMSYDQADGYVVLFGGYNGTYLNDTWTFSGGNWTHLRTPRAPIGRTDAAMAYDAQGRYVLLTEGNNAFSAASWLNDTWEFSHGRWMNVTAVGMIPPARTYVSAAYDAKLGGVVISGGHGASGTLGDTWLFNGRWSNITGTVNPAPRAGARMSFDARIGAVVLFGGYNNTTRFSDTWLLILTSWSLASPSHVPPAREYSNMAYDPSISSVVLFDGSGTSGNLNDTWTYH